MLRTFTKTFADPHTQQRSLAHHRWIARTNPDVRIPHVVHVHPTAIDYEHLDGHHGTPDDLLTLADLLGHQHTTAHTHDLHAARLNAPHTSADDTSADDTSHDHTSGAVTTADVTTADVTTADVTTADVTIDDFADSRRERLHRLLATGTVPSPLLTPGAIDDWLEQAATMPAAFYKDANPRNFLITDTTVAVVDFDSLTLAPFGYDLAKIIVTISMTTGPLPEDTIRRAVAAYNRHPEQRGLPGCSWLEFAAWCEFHHILTTPHHGTNGYRYSWHAIRPAWTTDILRNSDNK
ncbi:phosphotransferase [Kitasatospora sp. NPDC088160]|uniref:phosphotransferase n=1 Tax=Kitasatospora sp. NPDC088160 TaxID=3364072 RepID=UPI0037FFB073